MFELAHQEIKDRKGLWIDGSFVKWEELLDDTKICEHGTQKQKKLKYLILTKKLVNYFLSIKVPMMVFIQLCNQ